MRRFASILIVFSVLALFVGACAPKQLIYVYDFVDRQNLGTGENQWMATEELNVFFGENGVSINRSNLQSPYQYKGNFTIEIEIYLEDIGGERDEDILFEVCDLANENGAYLLLERQSIFGGEYAFRRYNPLVTTSESSGLPASLVLDAVNILKIVKTSGKVEFFLNDDIAPFGTIEDIIDSPSSYWALKFYAYDGWNEGIVYHGIRKVTIKYGPGNQAPVSV